MLWVYGHKYFNPFNAGIIESDVYRRLEDAPHAERVQVKIVYLQIQIKIAELDYPELIIIYLFIYSRCFY